MMNRRNFFKLLFSGVVAVAIPKIKPDDKSTVEASIYSYMRCPECGRTMTRIPGDNGEMFITCCGKTYKEPTIPLERIL